MAIQSNPYQQTQNKHTAFKAIEAFCLCFTRQSLDHTFINHIFTVIICL